MEQEAGPSTIEGEFDKAIIIFSEEEIAEGLEKLKQLDPSREDLYAVVAEKTIVIDGCDIRCILDFESPFKKSWEDVYSPFDDTYLTLQYLPDDHPVIKQAPVYLKVLPFNERDFIAWTVSVEGMKPVEGGHFPGLPQTASFTIEGRGKELILPGDPIRLATTNIVFKRVI